MPSQTLVGVVLVAIVLYATKLLFSRKKAPGPLPPGPKGKPILGNISDLPAPGTADWVHWLKHKDLYGRRFVMGLEGAAEIDVSFGKQVQSARSRSWVKPS
jgi:hypothetical protein